MLHLIIQKETGSVSRVYNFNNGRCSWWKESCTLLVRWLRKRKTCKVSSTIDILKFNQLENVLSGQSKRTSVAGVTSQLTVQRHPMLICSALTHRCPKSAPFMLILKGTELRGMFGTNIPQQPLARQKKLRVTGLSSLPFTSQINICKIPCYSCCMFEFCLHQILMLPYFLKT